MELKSGCRPGCGACCIAPSISSPVPGMPNGKPAGVVCFNLDPETRLCRIWNGKDYPAVCKNFVFDPEVCGDSHEHVLAKLAEMEILTSP